MSPFDSIRRHCALLASVAGNVALAACLLVMMWKARTASAPHASLPTALEHPVKSAAQERAASAQKTPPSPFHWKQLDAPDFATFVNNLRAVGCPEATIHDIVQGELAEIYAAKRQEAECQLGRVSGNEREVLRKHLRELAVEESSLLATLTTGGAVPVAPENTNTLASQQNSDPEHEATFAAAETAQVGGIQQEGVVLTPAAFMVGNDASQSGAMKEISVSPTDPMLDTATAQVITKLREDFAQSLEGAGNDPSSLFYRQRWLSAQRASDEVYSSLFGGDAFVRTQTEAMQKQQQGQAR